MKTRNDRSNMARIRVKRRALAPLLLGDWDYAESSVHERVAGRDYVASGTRVGRVVTWCSYPPPAAGSLLIEA